MIDELSVALPLAAVCVVISAFCSGTEVALFSIRRGEREQLARSKRFTDRLIAAMLDRPRRVVATVLVGNEAFNGLLVVLAFLVFQRWYPGPLAAPEPPDAGSAQAGPAWQAFWLAIAVALPLIVLVSEITAKTLAAKAALLWSRLCVLPLMAFAVIVAPVRIVVQAVSGVLLKPLGVVARPRSAGDLSEAEFRTLVDAGSAQGQVDARERRLIHRVFEFNDKNVGQVMTPRERIFALSYDLPAQRLVKELAARGFSRVPIYQKSLDNVRGILNAKDLVRTTAGQPLGRPLGELLHEPLFVPRTTPVKRLFLTFKQKKVHMALVVSEYGKVLGLVTMDDLLAQIFGVLRDERAELQSSIGPGRVQVRTPIGIRTDGEGNGLPVVPSGAGGPDANLGAVPVAHPVDDGLVHRGDDRSGPVMQPDSSPGSIGVLDPPPRPVHAVDEVTPPATDLADLLASGRAGDDQDPP
jgi:putative hemolysin